MAVTLNASTSSGFIATSDTSGDLALQANGSTKMTIGSSITMNSGGLITSGTQVTASTTVVDFTGIPSWVKRITVMLNNISTNGSSILLFRLGTTSGFLTSGYLGSASYSGTGIAPTSANSSSGFVFDAFAGAPNNRLGHVVFTNITGNTWVMGSTIGLSDAAAAAVGGGAVALSGTLDRLRLTATNGTDTFDGGTINILYEG